RTAPVSARSRPRRWRIRVVFPAPLAPTRPYTAPRDSSRLTPSSAILLPKRRLSPETEMTNALDAPVVLGEGAPPRHEAPRLLGCQQRRAADGGHLRPIYASSGPLS